MILVVKEAFGVLWISNVYDIVRMINLFFSRMFSNQDYIFEWLNDLMELVSLSPRNFLQNVAVTFGMTLLSIEIYASSGCWTWYQIVINTLTSSLVYKNIFVNSFPLHIVIFSFCSWRSKKEIAQIHGFTAQWGEFTTTQVNILRVYFCGLLQDYSISNALAMEILPPCTEPSISSTSLYLLKWARTGEVLKSTNPTNGIVHKYHRQLYGHRMGRS